MYLLNNTMKNFGAVTTICILSACSTAQPDYSSIARSEQAIEQAKQVKAQTYAPYWLNEAEKKLASANSAMKKEKYEEAKMRADEASAAAELANVSSRNKKAQVAVEELQKTINALKEQLTKKTTG